MYEYPIYVSNDNYEVFFTNRDNTSLILIEEDIYWDLLLRNKLRQRSYFYPDDFDINKEISKSCKMV